MKRALQGGEPAPARKRAAASDPALGIAPRAGTKRGNFVRLKVGKGGRFKGAGGRKFVNGCVGAAAPFFVVQASDAGVPLRMLCSASKTTRRSTSRSRVHLPDSTAPEVPLIDDEGFGTHPVRVPVVQRALAPRAALGPTVRGAPPAEHVRAIAQAKAAPTPEALNGSRHPPHVCLTPSNLSCACRRAAMRVQLFLFPGRPVGRRTAYVSRALLLGNSSDRAGVFAQPSHTTHAFALVFMLRFLT